MRPVLNDDERRMTPQTSYPFESKSSQRYEPSCPVIPVISARLPVAFRHVVVSARVMLPSLVGSSVKSGRVSLSRCVWV